VVRAGGDIRLLILRPSAFGVEPQPREAPPDTRVVAFAEVKGWLRGAGLRRHLLRYSEVELATHRVEYVSKPFPTALLLRALSRGGCWLSDDTGRRLRIGPVALLRYFAAFVRDVALIPWTLRRTRRAVDRLATPGAVPVLDLARPPLYVRGELQFGIRAGGSVGHVAGVLNNLGHFAGSPVFVTDDRLPTVHPAIETHVVAPTSDFCGFEEIPAIHFNGRLESMARSALAGRPVSFVYQRCGLFCFAGLALARERHVPFVLEYNGSEVWSARHWGRPLRHEGLATQVETTLLRAASLVVVVSRPLRDELLRRGIPEHRVLLNPNGVDAERYSPEVDGIAVRRRYRLEKRRVVGFIGTFGRWHGAPLLVEAIGILLARSPEWRDSVRLLMIGDGLTRPEVEARVKSLGLEEQVALTGLVPQEDGPAHLAACDVLVSPQVRNPDGTPFFGSPTKLFEYMAMGKAIVASNLDQLGEVLADGETGLLVEPGDVEGLASAIARLVGNEPLARRLGEAARRAVLARHTWAEHTGRIVNALRQSYPSRALSHA
jgi:glycosyltransferase involved in cell wall biosynthesis